MFTKKFFAVFIALFVVFFFASLLSASDDKKTSDKSEATVEVKTEGEAGVKAKEVKTEEKAPKSDTKAIKKININKATAIELSSVLKKVGPKYAAAIVKYREENGEFKAPEDIKNVKGIGNKIFELNKDVIVVSD
ncbi:MAG: helix-hairpin-helix domain-containing protein [Desulfamplus sp.]|nr:helix-hairpin-helix domain-containing protein [Desulfamplus sp.]